jgi:branched-chain amino acid aminotransferase
MPFYDYHFERILRGMKALKMMIPSYFNMHYMRNEISKVIEEQPFCRLRLAIWREEGGYYTPTNNNIDFLIESSIIPDKNYSFNDLGLTIGVFKDFPLRKTPISAFKTSNSLPYILAGKHAKENSWDDVLMLNTEGYVAEGITSNIFIFKDNKLITPSISSGCVGGVMRQIVIEMVQELKISVEEANLTLDMVREADEIFYTNAVQGIRWVDNFEQTTYPFYFSNSLYEKLLLRIS